MSGDRIATIIELAGQVYKPEGVLVWLVGKSGRLDGKRPVDLIAAGELDALEAQLRGMAEGVFV